MEMNLLVSDLLVIHAHILTSLRYILPTCGRRPPIPHAEGCRCTGLPVDAASCVIRCDNLRHAVELVEQGRGQQWSLASRLKNSSPVLASQILLRDLWIRTLLSRFVCHPASISPCTHTRARF
jgi:hypothetical protein